MTRAALRAALLAALAVACSSRKDGEAGRVPDTTPPIVLWTAPAGASTTSAPLTPTVLATFDEEIDCGRLPGDALAVTELGVAVAGHVECSGATLELVPVPALPTNTTLVARVSPLVRDLAGNALGTEHLWSFDVLPWTRHLGTAGSDYARAAAIDADGNVLVTGYTDASFAGTNAGSWDIVLAKLDPSGQTRWTRQLGTAGNDNGFAVATDAGRNVLVAGATNGSFASTSAGGMDVLVVKLDAAGTSLWARQLGTTAPDFAFAVATDAGGNVLVAGSTGGELDGHAGAGSQDLFAAKYDAAGTKLWSRQLGSTSWDYAYSLAVDAGGNAFVAGLTGGDLDGNVSAGSDDLFLVKYDPTGAKLWTRQFGTAAKENGAYVAVDADGNAFVAGATAGNLGGATNAGYEDLLVVKFDPAGNALWTRQLGSPGLDYGKGVAVDAGGNALVAGYTEADLDGNVSSGSHDLFLVKYGGGGDRLWTRQHGSPRLEDTYGVAADAAGNAFVVGYTTGDLDDHAVAGVCDAFVVKYGPDGHRR